MEVPDPSLPLTTKGPWEKSLTGHGPLSSFNLKNEVED